MPRYHEIRPLGPRLSGRFPAHIIGGWPDLADTYVRVLLMKILLVVLMMGLAVFNRYLLLPRLRTAKQAVTLRPLVRSIAVERLVGLLMLLDVSALGMMNPHG